MLGSSGTCHAELIQQSLGVWQFVHPKCPLKQEFLSPPILWLGSDDAVAAFGVTLNYFEDLLSQCFSSFL